MDIALALGGGGARGNAHIGVLRVLEKEGFRIRAVAGTSAGGLAAVFYAAGFSPDEIETLFAEVDQQRLYGRSSEDGPALLGLSGAREWLREHLGERRFADLNIPCAVTAVDIDRPREIILEKGSVVEALLATIAVPGIFPPYQLNDTRLVDGGVLDPVPVSVARSLAPGLPVVAVVLTRNMGMPARAWSVPMKVPLPPRIKNQLSRLRYAQAFNLFMESVDIGGRAVAELRLKIDKPEVIIRPDVGDIDILEEVDVHEVAKRGEEAALASLPELRKAVSWQGRLRRKFFREKGCDES